MDKQIEQHLRLIRERWKRGISKFQKKIDDFNTSDNKRIKTIRTSLYGDIILDDKELLLVDSFYMQRLREVSQMGFVYYVYPEARHSRFEHTLGVFWIIKKLLESTFWRSRISKRDRMNLICAALLHDIGHGPFSHFTESVLDYLGISTILRPKDNNCSKYHERKAANMVLKEDYLLKKLNVNTYYLGRVLKKLGANPEKVAKMITGDPKEKFAPLINGPVDADKLDYYQRDTFFTGVPTGSIDAEFLMRTLKFDNKNIYFTEKAFSNIIQMLFNREYVFSIVSYHPVVRTIQSMMLVAFVNALSLLSPQTKMNILLHLDMMDDNDFWIILDIIVSSRTNDKTEIVKDLLERFRSRDLYKRWFTLSLEECKKLGFGGDGEYIHTDFLPLKFILSGKQNRVLRKNEVIIFEISPQPEGKNKRKKKISDDFKKIYIKNSYGKVTSLYERLGKDKSAIADGLSSFQHQLNKALLLHPKIREKDTSKLPRRVIKELRTIAVPGLSGQVRTLLGEEMHKLRNKKR